MVDVIDFGWGDRPWQLLRDDERSPILLPHRLRETKKPMVVAGSVAGG
jgi:hypothetical protein